MNIGHKLKKFRSTFRFLELIKPEKYRLNQMQWAANGAYLELEDALVPCLTAKPPDDVDTSPADASDAAVDVDAVLILPPGAWCCCPKAPRMFSLKEWARAAKVPRFFFMPPGILLLSSSSSSSSPRPT